jgi:hypothetical protein
MWITDSVKLELSINSVGDRAWGGSICWASRVTGSVTAWTLAITAGGRVWWGGAGGGKCHRITSSGFDVITAWIMTTFIFLNVILHSCKSQLIIQRIVSSLYSVSRVNKALEWSNRAWRRRWNFPRNVSTLDQWHSTMFVCVSPDDISLEHCTVPPNWLVYNTSCVPPVQGHYSRAQNTSNVALLTQWRQQPEAELQRHFLMTQTSRKRKEIFVCVHKCVRVWMGMWM